jgi:DNA-binding CsgD family transcriptional regulator
MITFNWREPDGRFGLRSRPAELLTTHAELHRELMTSDLFDHHPLIGWFATTGDPAPWTSARVPTSIVSARFRADADVRLRPLGFEQQLAINYRLDGPMHRAFVLGRGRRDFDDEDLVVAAYVQRGLRALDVQSRLVAGLQPADGVQRACDIGLTGREISVLQLLGRGLSTRVIGRRLDCSPRTVEKHLERIYRKLGVTDRLNAVRAAWLAGIIEDVDALLGSAAHAGRQL